jgi:hypothetical protein
MALEPQRHDLEQELRATMAARHEVGTAYDDQFIQALVEKLTQQVRQEIEAARPPQAVLAPDQRLALGICSLIFGIPLIAIAAGSAGPVGLVVAFAAIVAINMAAGWSR